MPGRTFSNRRRVIVDSAAKNAADDQFSIAHALLSPSLDIRGPVAAPCGEIGEYLVRRLVEWNERHHGGSIGRPMRLAHRHASVAAR
ncbi:hypothetical protein [Nonomuraea sp. B19D2]|uniref:hypothetical protein n=1 Tax=Nonomuraea sp. B19D2 TaxID=3159561 RepID=UPI0032DBC1C9